MRTRATCIANLGNLAPLGEEPMKKALSCPYASASWFEERLKPTDSRKKRKALRQGCLVLILFRLKEFTCGRITLTGTF